MEKIKKPSRQFDDGVSLGGRGGRDSNKIDKNRARELKRTGEVFPEQSVPEVLPQELVLEVAPVPEEKLPESPKVFELSEIYGDKKPPASVEELFNKLKGKRREEYVAMLRGRMAEEAQIVDVSEKHAPQYEQGEPVHMDEAPEEVLPSVFHSGRENYSEPDAELREVLYQRGVPEADIGRTLYARARARVRAEEDLPVLTEVVPEVVEEEKQYIRNPEDLPQNIHELPEEAGTPKENRSKFLNVMAQAKEKFAWWKSSDEHFIRRSQELDAEAEKIGKIEGLFRSLGENYNKLGWKSKLAVGAGLGIGAGLSASFMFPTALAVCVTGIVGQRAAGLATMYLKFEKGKQDEKWGKEKAMGKAIAYTAGMTGAMMLLSEGVKEGVQYANQHNWLGTMLGHQQNPSASGEIHYAPAPHMPEMPTVSATHGHGYEYMMKRLWEDLQEKRITLPPNADQNSDLYKLVHADAHTINTVVHQIANDPAHGFYNSNGSSVMIDPSAHMTIGTDGQLHLGVGDAAHQIDVVHTTPEMQAHVTPAYYPEAPVVETSLPGETLPPFEMHPLDLTPSETDTILSHSEASLSVGEHLNAPIIDESSFHNIFGLDVPVAEAHIYTGPYGKHLFVYGGTPKEKIDAVVTFLTKNPDKVVLGSDDNGVGRFPWSVVDGKIVPGTPMQTGFIFKTMMKAPNPNEFQKVIM